ncbi:uncharacterized protein PRCAT00000021001 [Priceomyces carsonii]|uniref:uncharacterized protein n=1 Tax=Priceomyces carsonii TaxID=28549 RepID=UPI002EDB52C6|nr:unnamed protein product [Priceomyces carsonii]
MSFFPKSLKSKSAGDIVILAAKRTPISRSKKGPLANSFPEELLKQAIEGTINASGIERGLVEDVLVGTVLQNLGGQKASALAVKSLGFPPSTTINTINRQCSSSAQALTYMANSIRCNDNKIAIAAGVESMTFDYFPHRGIPTRISPHLLSTANQESKDVLMPMGITSENVAKKYGISRNDQDLFAFESHVKALKARDSGHFAKEIVPVVTHIPLDEEGKSFKTEVVTEDDGIRSSISLKKLSELKPVFDENGTTTAGNSSQISDGASAVLITTREVAESLNLKPVARYISSSVAGVESKYMGIGPAVAVPKLLNKLGLGVNDINLWELNEAFASQSLYVIDKLKIDPKKVNIFGGAIALGHPLGATGARCISTLINALETTGEEVGVVSMCTSTGQGYAGLIVKE